MDDDTFNYFNVDINLLALQVLLEGFYRGQSVFRLEEFIKGNYWKIDEIEEEIRDSNDHGSVEDLVMHQVIQIIKDLELASIKRVSVARLSELTEKVIREAVYTKDGTEDDVVYFSSIISEVYDLKKIEDEQTQKRIDAGVPIKEVLTTKRADFTRDSFGRHLQYISSISAPFIELEVEYNDAKAYEVEEAIVNYVFSFSQDDYVENKPAYRQKRFYFTKQIENFFEYIKALPEIDGSVNVSFSALNEQGFEVVKVLTYLEREKRIKVRNWNDTELWNVKFHKTPITLFSLLGQEVKVENNSPKSSEIKLNLSFSSSNATLSLTDENGKEYKVKLQGQVQKDVLRVVFEHPQNIYSDWSLYDISETIGAEGLDEKAVRNAIYQFNRKVRLSIPEVENLFELTQHYATLNPKYVNKN
jgi:hypothetical protein